MLLDHVLALLLVFVDVEGSEGSHDFAGVHLLVIVLVEQIEQLRYLLVAVSHECSVVFQQFSEIFFLELVSLDEEAHFI